MMKRPSSRRAAIHFLLISVAATPALAQPVQPATDESGISQAGADADIGDIVVTARKRTETLQRVPVSAAVVTGPLIASQGIANVQDLTRTVPGVQLSQGTVANRQIVRGIGSGDNPAFEQSVGTFVDDIYHGRSRSSEGALFDIQRVEVLKGPQTTYFGANAIAGALNIVTRDPGDSFAGNVRALYTPAFHGYQVEAGVDLPVNETLAIRVAGQASGGNGWISDIGTGQHVPRTRNYAGRATILWKPTDTLTVRLKAQRSEARQQGGLQVTRQGCPQPAAFGAPSGFCAAIVAANAAPFSGTYVRNSSPGQRIRLLSDDYVGTITLDADRFTLTSVTGYSDYSYDLRSDLDSSPLPLLGLQNPEKYRQFSQEVRITSDDSGPIEYLAGIYYQHSRLDPRQILTYGFLSPTIAANPGLAALRPYLPLAIDNRYREQADTQSMFGALTWKPATGLQLTGALRYSLVDKDFTRTIGLGTGSFAYADPVPLPAAVAPVGAAFAGAAGLAAVGNTRLTRTDDHLSRSVSVQYEPSRDVMLYGRYDNGFKAGGFNGIDQTSTANLLSFAPEKVNAFEVGAKTRLLDGRATFNVALFRSKFSDLQLSGIAPTASGAFVNRVQNAGGAVSRGIEVDATLRVSDALRTSVSGAYLDAYYTRYANATPTAMQTLQGLRFQDLSGARPPLAPKWSGNWTVDYSLPVTDGLTLKLTNTLFYKSGVFLNPNNDPFTRQAGYVREDLTIALASENGWELSVIGKNLTDHVIRSFGAALPTSLGTYLYITEPPRNISLQLKYGF
jgi:iron complex outermembrane receptor protein